MVFFQHRPSFLSQELQLSGISTLPEHCQSAGNRWKLQVKTAECCCQSRKVEHLGFVSENQDYWRVKSYIFPPHVQICRSAVRNFGSIEVRNIQLLNSAINSRLNSPWLERNPNMTVLRIAIHHISHCIHKHPTSYPLQSLNVFHITIYIYVYIYI